MATNTWDIPTMQPAAGLLGKDFKTWSMNSNWDGSGADAISSSIAGRVMADKALMQKLGLTDADIQFKAGGYQNDAVVDDQYTLSDKAKQALAGLSMSRTGVAGKKDGRSQVLRDAQGNVLSAGQAYTHDPSGDLKDAALKAAAVMAAAYGGAQALGLDGGATAATAAGGEAAAGGAAAEGAGGGMLSGLDAAAVDMGAGAVAGGAEAAGAAGAAGAAAGDSAVKAALFGNTGYGAGMSGAATSAFDTVLGLTGSTTLASGAAGLAGAASSGADWLTQSFGAITGGGGAGGSLLGGLFSGSTSLRDILGLVGAGVQQYNLEKMAKDNRDWQSAEREKERKAQEKKESDTRRRQMPTTGAGLLGKFSVIPGGGNGG